MNTKIQIVLNENFVTILNTDLICNLLLTKTSQKLLNKGSYNLPVEIV